MKRKILILFFFNVFLFLHGQSISYYTKNESYIFYNDDVFIEIPLDEQGDAINKGISYEYLVGDEYYCFENGENHSLIKCSNGKWLLLDDLKRKNYNSTIHKNINGIWIAAYYYDVYNVNNVSELKKNETFWDKEWKYDGDRWQDMIYPSSIYLADNYFIINTNDGFEREYLIISENDPYEFNVYLGDSFITPDFYSKINFINNYKNKGFYQFKIELDGDYLYLYDKEMNKLLMKYARTEDWRTDRAYLREIANGNQIIKSNITWPRHADGTCDYDDEIKPPMTQLSDNDSVSEEEENATPSDLISEDEECAEKVEENVPVVKNASSLPLVIIVVSAIIMLLFIVIILIVRKKKK